MASGDDPAGAVIAPSGRRTAPTQTKSRASSRKAVRAASTALRWAPASSGSGPVRERTYTSDTSCRPEPAATRMLDLAAIEGSLRALQGAMPAVNRSLPNDHPPLPDASLGAMLAGYAELDRLARRGIDLFARGQARRLLELNRLVLYGERSPCVRSHARALDSAEHHFYESREGGVGDFVDWYARHRTLSPSRLAAGLYLRLQSNPQLYVEGNHRTGALILSHVLMRHGRPPLVLTPALACEWFALTPDLQRLSRHGPGAIFQARRLQHRLALLVRELADSSHLTAPHRDR